MANPSPSTKKETTMSLDDAMAAANAVADILELPAGEYAIVEIMGHRTLVGRIAEVERFGTKFAAIEPIWQDKLMPPVMVGGASIFQVTPCSAEVAKAKQATSNWELPAPVRAILPEEPPLQIEAPGPHAEGWFDNDDLELIQWIGRDEEVTLSDIENKGLSKALDYLVNSEFVLRGEIHVTLTYLGREALQNLDDYIPF